MTVASTVDLGEVMGLCFVPRAELFPGFRILVLASSRLLVQQLLSPLDALASGEPLTPNVLIGTAVGRNVSALSF